MLTLSLEVIFHQGGEGGVEKLGGGGGIALSDVTKNWSAIKKSVRSLLLFKICWHSWLTGYVVIITRRGGGTKEV